MKTSDNTPFSVLVIGGGIAGLTAAVTLRNAGHTVEVLEREPDWAAAGWGLSLTGPALRALAMVGVADTCIAAGYGITAITNCTVDGEVLNTIELPSLLGEGRPAQIGLGRPKLSSILREAAVDRGAELRTGLTVSSVAEDEAGVEAQLSDGSSRRVDLMVGADGVGSHVRGLLGIDEHPVFTGQWVWRVSVDRPDWAHSLHTFTAPNHSSGLIPISAHDAYIFCTECTGSEERHDDPAERVPRIRQMLSPLGGAMTDVVAAIDDPQRIVARPILSLHVDGPWHSDRCVLIGDAVHTGGPQMVSGAALAIEDAVLLTEHLGSNTDLRKVLSSFQERRHHRTRLVINTTLEIGKLECAHRYADVHALQRDCHAAMAEAI
ncbi:MAG: FAD-dependent monooxygenase [Mycobacteriaceae bacterium]|nr:FAD-dependent monooxygenase [Mycobacteriaceae bacterium]